jgi:hypothetical protein
MIRDQIEYFQSHQMIYKTVNDVRPSTYFGKRFDDKGTHAWIGEHGLSNVDNDFLVPREDLYHARYGYIIFDVKTGEIQKFCSPTEQDELMCAAYNRSVRNNTEIAIGQGQVFYPGDMNGIHMIGQNIHAYSNNLQSNGIESVPVSGAWEYIKSLLD